MYEENTPHQDYQHESKFQYWHAYVHLQRIGDDEQSNFDRSIVLISS